jgi:hypothetical protein
MGSAARIPAAAAAAVLLSVLAARADAQPALGTTYSGWATYYGTPPMAPNTHVHCHLPNIDNASGFQGVTRTIAVNADQYGGSAACGMCAEVWGSGKMCAGGVQGPDCGLGQDYNAVKDKFLAVVTDELWERGYGDIDIGVAGDGKYPVQWKPVACPWAKTNARIVLHEGANAAYMKVQFRYLDSAVRWVQNVATGETSNYRYHDNFMVFAAGGDGIGGWSADGKLEFRAESALGTQYCGTIDRSFNCEPYEYSAWPC